MVENLLYKLEHSGERRLTILNVVWFVLFVRVILHHLTLLLLRLGNSLHWLEISPINLFQLIWGILLIRHPAILLLTSSALLIPLDSANACQCSFCSFVSSISNRTVCCFCLAAIAIVEYYILKSGTSFFQVRLLLL